VGLASWYGDDFCGKAKASGENFDKMALTAAHKTLPIPSVVKVTNIKTGRSVIVVVDDRGPFVYSGRIIDLSYGAANVIGLSRGKPSPVRVQALVSDSLRLSHYIRRHCKKKRDPYGRTWAQLYFQEICDYRRTQLAEPTPARFSAASQTHSSNRKVPSVKKTTPPKTKPQKPSRKKYNGLGRYLNKYDICF
jgi:rare lipoprotein A (peptidoglycan hydrolase)